jgi:hypothetical protein
MPSTGEDLALQEQDPFSSAWAHGLPEERSPEPIFLKWKGIETNPEGDFFVRSGPGTVRLPPESAKEYVRTRFPGWTRSAGCTT